MDYKGYIGREKVAELQREIQEKGFQADPIVAHSLDTPVYGLNLTILWPLPLLGIYQNLIKALAHLDDSVYVYPLSQTHVNLITLVSFKMHQAPSPQELKRLKKLIGPLTELFYRYFFEQFNGNLTKCNVQILPTVMVSRGAFGSIINKS